MIRKDVPFAAADLPSSRLSIEVAALRQENKEVSKGQSKVETGEEREKLCV